MRKLAKPKPMGTYQFLAILVSAVGLYLSYLIYKQTKNKGEL